MENYGYYSKEINEDCFVVYYLVDEPDLSFIKQAPYQEP